MNICENQSTPKKYIAGRLYKWTSIYIATEDGKLINLANGHSYEQCKHPIENATDVTDQYCLKKV